MPSAPTQEGDSQEAAKDEELVESAIKASVFVPMATKCVFLRKGKELILDLAEPGEAGGVASSPSEVGAGTGAAADGSSATAASAAAAASGTPSRAAPPGSGYA